MGPERTVGEKGHVEGQPAQMAFRRLPAPIDLRDIAEGLESVEGNAHGQKHAQPGQSHAPQQGPKGIAKEVVVLEDEKQAQIEGQGRQKATPPAPALRQAGHPTGAEIDTEGGEPQ